MAYTSPYKLPDEHMRLVGIIAAHWEHVDYILQRAVAEVMGFQMGTVQLLTENLSVAAKIDLLIAYARESLDKEEFSEFTKVIGKVQSAYGRRNTFVHAKWGPNDSAAAEPWRISWRTKGGRISVVNQPTPLSDLEEAAQMIWQTCGLLTDMLRFYDILLPAPQS